MKLKLAHELKTGDKIIFQKIITNKYKYKYVDYDKVTVVGYIQCGGMGSFEFGEYGLLYLNDEDQTKVSTYKNAPFLVEEESAQRSISS